MANENTLDGEKAKISKSQPRPKEKSDMSTVYVVFLSLIIDLLGFTVILPLLPSHFDYYSSHDSGGLYPWLVSKVKHFQEHVGAPDEFNKVLFGGLIGSLFSFLQYLSSPIMGAMSDVYGRKPILLISMLFISLSYGVWAVSSSFSIFVLARILGGVSKGNVGLSAAIVTDVSTEKTRGKGMALIGVAFSIGFIIGPMIGAGFSAWAKNRPEPFFVAPAIFALTLGLADVLFIAIFLKESLPKENRAVSVSKGFSEAFKFINPVSLFNFSPVEKLATKDRSLLCRTGLVYFIYLLLYSGLEYSLTFLTHTKFNFTSMQQGKMYLFSGLIMAAVQGGYLRRIAPGSEIKIICRGLLIIIPAFVIIGFSNKIWTLSMGLALYAFASATVVPCLTTLASNFGSVEQKGTVLGIFRSLGALARALGPLLSSTVYWSLGPQKCYCIGGALLIVPYFLMRFHGTALQSRKKQ